MSAEESDVRGPFIDQLIADFLLEQEQQGPRDPEMLIAQHPEYERELREYFANELLLKNAFGQPFDDESDSVAGEESADDQQPQTKSLVGQQFGDYLILEELGAGGMGIVYKAKQTSIGRIVALKMIRAGNLATPQDVQRFYDEARAQARLCHPGIVAVHEVGSIDGQHYFTMDYVSGGSLTRLQRDESVSSRRAAKLVRRMAESMHYAHENRVVHRDLKPANVLLDRRGAPRITDFGLAKLKWNEDETRQLTKTATGQILGTAGYMAPEQAEGRKDVASPADVYSLGAVLYALLTGRAPFVGETIASTLMQVVHSEPISPKEFNPEVPADLETICLKCLEKDPARRYVSAQELAEELKRFLNRDPIFARPVGSFERSLRWKSRNPGIFKLILVTFGVLLAGVSVSSLFAHRSLTLSGELQQLQDENTRVTEQLATANSGLQDKVEENSALQSVLAQRLREIEQGQLETAVERAKARLTSGLPGQSLEAWASVVNHARRLQSSDVSDSVRHSLREVAVASQLLPDLRYVSTWRGELTASADIAMSPDFEWLAFGMPAEGRVLVRRRSSEIADRMEIESSVSANKSYFGFSDDVKWLSSFDYSSKFVRFLDLQNGVERHQVSNVLNWRAVSFHPTESFVVVGQSTGDLVKLNLTNGETQTITTETSPVVGVRHSPDGTMLAYCLTDGTVCVRSSRMDSEAAAEPTAKVAPLRWNVLPGSKTLAWSPTGAVLAIGEKNRVNLYHVGTQSDPDIEFALVGHDSEVTDIFWNAFSPVIATSGQDGTSRIWDAVSGELLLKLPGRIRGFSSDGRRIAVRQSEFVEFYELIPATVVARLQQIAGCSAVAIHSEVPLLSFVEEDGVSLVNSANGKLLNKLPMTDCQSVCFNPAEQTLIVSSATGLWEWPIDVSTVPAGILVRLGPPHQIVPDITTAGMIRISRQSSRLLWRDNKSQEARILDLVTDETIKRLEGVALSTVDISPDGLFAVGGDEYSSQLQIWDTNTGAVITTLPFEDGFPFIRFSHDGRWLAANGLTSVGVWSVEDWKQKHSISLNCHGPAGLAFTPDDSILAVGRWGRSLQLIELESGKTLTSFDSPVLPTTLRDLVITNNGLQLFGLSHEDGVYSLNLGELRTRLSAVGLDWSATPAPAAVDSPWTTANVAVDVDWGELALKLTTNAD